MTVATAQCTAAPQHEHRLEMSTVPGAVQTALTAGLGTLDLLSRQGMHLPILSSPVIIIQLDVSDDLLNGIV